MSPTPIEKGNTKDKQRSSPPKFKRLHEITTSEIREWQEERGRVGREKYKDKHQNRYGLVDVMEELLDSLNIINLIRERADYQGVTLDVEKLKHLHTLISQAIYHATEVDESLPDSLCTDEQGGERIWWPPEGDRRRPTDFV